MADLLLMPLKGNNMDELCYGDCAAIDPDYYLHQAVPLTSQFLIGWVYEIVWSLGAAEGLSRES